MRLRDAWKCTMRLTNFVRRIVNSASHLIKSRNAFNNCPVRRRNGIVEFGSFWMQRRRDQTGTNSHIRARSWVSTPVGVESRQYRVLIRSTRTEPSIQKHVH